jgi:hypothetical protein
MVADVLGRRQADRSPVGVDWVAEHRLQVLGVEVPQDQVVALVIGQHLARPGTGRWCGDGTKLVEKVAPKYGMPRCSATAPRTGLGTDYPAATTTASPQVAEGVGCRSYRLDCRGDRRVGHGGQLGRDLLWKRGGRIAIGLSRRRVAPAHSATAAAGGLKTGAEGTVGPG